MSMQVQSSHGLPGPAGFCYPEQCAFQQGAACMQAALVPFRALSAGTAVSRQWLVMAGSALQQASGSTPNHGASSHKCMGQCWHESTMSWSLMSGAKPLERGIVVR